MRNSSIGLAGEFYVLHRLFLEGYEPTLTLGNAKGVDILVLNTENNKTFKVEVKTTKSKSKWMLTEKHEQEDKNLIYCFVFIDLEDKKKKPQTFFVSSKDVAEYTKEKHKKWWSNRKSSTKEKHEKEGKEMVSFPIREFHFDRLNIGKKENYEDNFELFN